MEDPTKQYWEPTRLPLGRTSVPGHLRAVVSGVGTWKDVVLFGENKPDWLRQHFPYKNGVPVASTLGRLFMETDNEQFTGYIIDRVAALSEPTHGPGGSSC